MYVTLDIKIVLATIEYKFCILVKVNLIKAEQITKNHCPETKEMYKSF